MEARWRLLTDPGGAGRMVGWGWRSTEDGTGRPVWALAHAESGLAIEKAYDPPGLFSLLEREVVFVSSPGKRRRLLNERLTLRGPGDVVAVTRGVGERLPGVLRGGISGRD